jgi:uncharacterized RDD family membrane protein YckC
VSITMPDVSPYAPPRADEYAASAPVGYGGLQDASLGTRFANLMLDSIGRMVFMFALVMPLALLKLETLSSLAVLIGVLGYHFLFEVTLGRTPGKFLTGTRVVSADGSRASAGQILGRTLARFVPFEPFSFLFGGNPASGWHDKWSNTRVVKM